MSPINGKEAMPLGDPLAWFRIAMQTVTRITNAAIIHDPGHDIPNAISQTYIRYQISKPRLKIQMQRSFLEHDAKNFKVVTNLGSRMHRNHTGAKQT